MVRAAASVPLSPGTEAFMIVYCSGPPDNDGQPSHDRFPVKRYGRISMGWRDGADVFGWTPCAGADDPRPKPSHGWKLRFHCKKCGFDWKRTAGLDRKLDRKNDSVYEFGARITAIFEPLHAAGVHEVDVRLLVRWLTP
jgi:hypothetical protein